LGQPEVLDRVVHHDAEAVARKVLDILGTQTGHLVEQLLRQSRVIPPLRGNLAQGSSHGTVLRLRKHDSLLCGTPGYDKGWRMTMLATDPSHVANDRRT